MMPYHLWRKLYLQTKMSGAFNRILRLLTKKIKKGKMVARACPRFHQNRMTGPPPTQTSIHWTINCVGAGRMRLHPKAQKSQLTESCDCEDHKRNSSGHDLWIDRWLAQMFVALWTSKRRLLWVTTIEMSYLKYFLSFLKILFRYLLYLHLNKCLKYRRNLWLYWVHTSYLKITKIVWDWEYVELGMPKHVRIYFHWQFAVNW